MSLETMFLQDSKGDDLQAKVRAMLNEAGLRKEDIVCVSYQVEGTGGTTTKHNAYVVYER